MITTDAVAMRDYLNIAEHVLIFANSEGRIIEYNTAALHWAQRCLGAELSIGYMLSDIFLPFDKEFFHLSVVRAVRGETVRSEQQVSGEWYGYAFQPIAGSGTSALHEIAFSAINITERMRNENALRHSEERYRQLFEHNPQPMWVFDLETLGFLMVNEAAIRKYGYSRQEFRAMTLLDIRPATDIPRLAGHLTEQHPDGLHDAGIWKHRKHDGTLIDVEITSHNLSFDGRAARLVMANDITGRIVAELRLQNLNRLYAALSQVNQTIVRSKTREELFARICNVSIEYAQLMMAWIGLLDETGTRLLPQAFDGKEAGFLTAVADYDATTPVVHRRPTWQAVYTDGYAVCTNIGSDNTDERWRIEALLRGYRSAAAVPLKLRGKIIGVYCLYAGEAGFFSDADRNLMEEIGMDISFALDTMETEKERQAAENSMRTSEQRLRTTLDCMMEGCQIIGYDWRYLYVNDATVEHGRRSKELLLGYTMMEAYPGIETTPLFALLLECMEHRVRHQLENEFTFPDGAIGWFELTIEPVPEGIFILSLDVTARKNAELAIQQLNRDLEKRVVERTAQLSAINHEKDELLSIIAHDLRNPLTSILLTAETVVAVADRIAIDKIVERMGAIRSSVHLMADILDHLSSLAVLDSGLIRFDIVQFDAVNLLLATVQNNLAAAQAKGMSIILEAEEGLTVMADEAKTSEVIDNLLSNAIKYSARETTIIVRGFGTESDGMQRVRFEVQDQGPGISEEDQKSLYSKFVRLSAKPTGGEKSTGLGLFIAKKLTEGMNGRIWCASTLGSGSRFIVELPTGQTDK